MLVSMRLNISNVRGIKLFLIAFIASAAMLTVIQPPVGWSFLAWVCLVPFILVCDSQIKSSALFWTAYIISFFYWLGNSYWIEPVTAAGWVALCLYLALLWPLTTIALRWCMMKKVPLFLATPLLIVGAERLQCIFWGGFFWRFLAHSQYATIRLIQICDIFGAGGISFLIAMVNGLIADWIIAIINIRKGNHPINWGAKFMATALVVASIVGSLVYGNWRINQSDKFITEGPVIASVQSNVPQSVKESHAATEQILDDLLKESSVAAKSDALLIVWPETMVQAVLDERVLKILDSSHSYNIFDQQLRKQAKENKVYILAGATGGVPEIKPDSIIELVKKYNSAFLYHPDGTKSDKQYNKIHLVPFGEVVPFKKSFPPLYRLLMKFTPYDYDYSLDYGSEYTVFYINDFHQKPQQTYKFGVIICYEDSVPAIARRCVLDEDGSKRIDWLINISNDGWFVRFSQGKVCPSTELSQHTAVCVFRTVENRIAVLRSVNTGISCLIDSLGRVKNGFLAGNLPYKAMDREGIAGWFADRVPIDKRITFFSKYGQWLDFCCAIFFISIIIILLSGRFLKKRSR